MIILLILVDYTDRNLVLIIEKKRITTNEISIIVIKKNSFSSLSLLPSVKASQTTFITADYRDITKKKTMVTAINRRVSGMCAALSMQSGEHEGNVIRGQ